MALRGRDKIVIVVPKDFDPDFDEHLDQREKLSQWVTARKAKLIEYAGGADVVAADPVKAAKIHEVVWKEVALRVVNYQLPARAEADGGAMTHLGAALSGLYRDLRKPGPHGNDARGSSAPVLDWIAKNRQGTKAAS